MTRWSVITRPRAFAYSREFRWAELWDRTLQYLVEAGIVKHKLGYGLPNAEICPLNLGSKERQLRNSDLFTTYAVILVGFAVSLTAFVGEIAYIHRERLCCAAKLLLPPQEEQFNPGKKLSPPPPYHTLFGPGLGMDGYGQGHGHGQPTRQLINGREYWVFRSADGETRLVPVRQPSALLFHYTH